jgi:hypothetical protein
VVVGAPERRRDRRGHVAVLDQLDARPRVADLLDQVVVARPVEDDRRDVAGAAAERRRNRLDVLGDRTEQPDPPAGRRADGHLPHVHVRKRHQRSRLPDRDHRHRAVAPARDDAAALERVEREVDALASRPDRLARRELVLLVGGADHDPPLDRERLERLAHPRGGVALGSLLVGPSEPARTRERGPFGHAQVRLAQAELEALRGEARDLLRRRSLCHAENSRRCPAPASSRPRRRVPQRGS